MSPKKVIFKLHDMKEEQGKASKREALDVAIKAVEAHEVEKECGVKEETGCLYFKDGPNGGETGKTIILVHCCPTCGEGLGMIKPFGGFRSKPFPKYCRNCGQKLKAPEE